MCAIQTELVSNGTSVSTRQYHILQEVFYWPLFPTEANADQLGKPMLHLQDALGKSAEACQWRKAERREESYSESCV